MKKLIFIILIQIVMNNCFSQEQLIHDPYSGMEMELSTDKHYLTVSNIKAGSPADLVPVRNGDRIFVINEQNVADILDCMEYFRNNKGNSMQIGVKRLNDTETFITIPRVSIDLFSKNFYTECELFTLLSPTQMVTVTNWVSQKELFNDLENKVQLFDNPQAYYAYKSSDEHKFCYHYIKKNFSDYNQVTVLGDESKNPANYKTFDFEYTSLEEPLLEKNLLYKLENHLLKLGLSRDSENPDILIIISFYSGQKEQYIPPQQIISTKIQSYFNWYWGYIPVPITESTTKEGYTKVTYLTNINLKFLDTKEILTSKVPPVLWSASFSELSPNKTFLSDVASGVFNILLLQYPKVFKQNFENYKINKYSYTGIIYDKNNVSIIADVIPGSPAYNLGLRKGDEIIRIENRKLPDDLENFFLHWNDRSDYRNAHKYIFKNSALSNGNSTLFKPLSSDYEGYLNSVDEPIVFSVKKGGKKADLAITAEYKNVVSLGHGVGLTIE